MSGFLDRWSGVTDGHSFEQRSDALPTLRASRMDRVGGSERCLTGISQPNPNSDVLKEIAALLASAYRRSKNHLPVGNVACQASGDDELANSGAKSVHGGVL